MDKKKIVAIVVAVLAALAAAVAYWGGEDPVEAAGTAAPAEATPAEGTSDALEVTVEEQPAAAPAPAPGA